MELLKNAWRNIFRRPSRSLLTILSIAIGAFSVMVIGTIGQLGQQAVTAELSSLGLQGMLLSAEGEAALTRECLSRAEEVPQVAEATPLLVNYTDILVRGSEEKAVVWGVDADVTRIISMNLLYGRGITAEDIRSGARVCVVPLWLLGFAILFSVLIGLGSGYYPAGKAVRIPALEAIKNE